MAIKLSDAGKQLARILGKTKKDTAQNAKRKYTPVMIEHKQASMSGGYGGG